LLIGKKEDLTRINSLSFELLNVGFLYIRKNAYRLLIDSGDIRFMKDFSAQKRIINLYEYYGWTESYNQSTRNAYQEDFFPYIKENFDLINASLQDESIYFSKQFKNALSTYRYALDVRIKKLKDCKKEIDDFLKVMNQNKNLP